MFDEKKMVHKYDKYDDKKVKIIDVDGNTFIGKIVYIDTAANSDDGQYWFDVADIDLPKFRGHELTISESEIKEITIIDK